jgi:hypothetical protein
MLASFGPSNVGGTKSELVTFAPVVTDEQVCTAAGHVVVPLGPKGVGKLALGVRAVGPGVKPLVDDDRLKLTCTAF